SRAPVRTRRTPARLSDEEEQIASRGPSSLTEEELITPATPQVSSIVVSDVRGAENLGSLEIFDELASNVSEQLQVEPELLELAKLLELEAEKNFFEEPEEELLAEVSEPKVKAPRKKGYLKSLTEFMERETLYIASILKLRGLSSQREPAALA